MALTFRDATREQRRLRLGRLLAPRHIAYVGGRAALTGINHCRAAGFDGPVWLVNHRQAEIEGNRCFPSIADLPEPPDATFVSVPREPSIAIARALAERDAGGMVCHAAGYAELDAEGARLQQALVEAAGPVALLGPNCLGIANRVRGAHLWLVPCRPERVARGPALISQSGGLGLHIMMNGRSVEFSYVVSVGNQAAIAVEDVIDLLVDDPHVSAIGVYLEGLRDVPAFHAAALRALDRAVPIVVLKGGRSPAGAAVTLSHTSSLAGEPALYAALFERLGIAGVETPAELLETLKLHATGPRPRGNRVLIYTCSGGSSSVAADQATRAGLTLPALPEATAQAVEALLPEFASAGNPLDYNTSLWGKEEELVGVFGASLGPHVDAGVLAIDYTPPAYGACEAEFAVCRALVRARERAGTPVYVCSILEELMPEAARLMLAEHGIAALQGIQHGLAAIASAARFEAARAAPRPAAPAPAATLGTARTLDEPESKALLGRYGLAVPEGRVVGRAEVAAAAAALGFPLALKAASAAIAHKTEAGAVRLGLGDAAAAQAAADEMAARLGVGRFLVERMVPRPAAEMIVGVVRDATFGLVLALGAGGTLVEVLKDSALLLLPTDEAAIRRTLDGLRARPLLDGVRGAPPADLDALVAAVLAVQRFALDHADRLLEIDVNPLMVLPRGAGAVAADALVRLADTPPAA